MCLNHQLVAHSSAWLKNQKPYKSDALTMHFSARHFTLHLPSFYLRWLRWCVDIFWNICFYQFYNALAWALVVMMIYMTMSKLNVRNVQIYLCGHIFSGPVVMWPRDITWQFVTPVSQSNGKLAHQVPLYFALFNGPV